MLKIHVNTPFHNEGWLFKETLKNWYWYNVDEFVFVDDHSTDDSVDVIKEKLGNRATILKSPANTWHESGVRSTAWEYSRSKGADILISLDADELLSANVVGHWDQVMEIARDNILMCPQFNVVGNTLTHRRNDPAYVNNVRDFIYPMSNSNKFQDIGAYHSPRCPGGPVKHVNVGDYGTFLHLQAANIKYYALKQLWYKSFEFVNYGYTAEQINGRYDYVVNNLDFRPVEIPDVHYDGLNIDFSIFERRIKEDGRFAVLAEQYNKFKFNPEYQKIITFGRNILEEYCNSI